MATMIVEMTDDEVRTAIVEWAEKHHGMNVDPTNVSITVETAYRGQGAMEEQYHKPVVNFVSK